MEVFEDLNGRHIRLTEERMQHILEHLEMQGQIERIAETLKFPDVIVASKYDPSVHLYHRFYEVTPVESKYLVVTVKFLEDDAFMLTAFFTDRKKKGDRIWPK